MSNEELVPHAEAVFKEHLAGKATKPSVLKTAKNILHGFDSDNTFEFAGTRRQCTAIEGELRSCCHEYGLKIKEVILVHDGWVNKRYRAYVSGSLLDMTKLEYAWQPILDAYPLD